MSLFGTAPSASREIVLKVDDLIMSQADRDNRMREVRAIRTGYVDALFDGMLSEQWPRPVVANLIDTSARATAEVIGALPALSCASGSMKSDADKKRAATKNKIGRYYWDCSRLVQQMKTAADQFITYGFLPMLVEPNFVKQMPQIQALNPWGCYFENDRWGDTRLFVRRWFESAASLVTKFPNYRNEILGDRGVHGLNDLLEVRQYHDDKQNMIYLPARRNCVLVQYPNAVSRCVVQVAELPAFDEQNRGHFDQVIWVQLARARLGLLTLDMADKAVNAPLVLPRDANEIEFGENSIIRTDGRVGRVPLEVSPSVVGYDQKLQQEQLLGQRTPEGLFGHADASVITGRGMQALMGGFDTFTKTCQDILGDTLDTATSLCFELDQAYWPDVQKRINGTIEGESFEITYTPAKDIAGNYSCKVTYGFGAGQSPSAALVMMLQLDGAGVISKDTVRRNLPFDVDAEQMQRAIDVEKLNEAALQGLQAFAQAIGPMVTQGMDPRLMLNAVAQVVKGRGEGKPLPDLMLAAFQPPEPTQPEQAPQTTAETAAGAAGSQPPAGMDEGGLQPGVAYGQQGRPPGGMPDVMTLINGLRGGRPVADATTTQRIPTG